MRRGVPARIFVPTICITGQDQSHSQLWRRPGGWRRPIRRRAGRRAKPGLPASGAMAVHAVRPEPHVARPGHDRSRAVGEQAPQLRHPAGSSRRRRPDRRHRRLVRGQDQGGGHRAEGAPTLTGGLRQRGRPVDAPTGSIAADSLAPRPSGRADVPHSPRATSSGAVLVSERGDPSGAARALWATLRLRCRARRGCSAGGGGAAVLTPRGLANASVSC